MTAPPVLRAGRDGDAEDFIALIGACWAEYPGCVMDVDGEVPELRALASYFAAQGGALWAAEQGGRVVGMVGTRPLGEGDWEICKMYAYPGQRGSGLAQTLIATAEAHARARGAAAMRLWSDTRFDRAHRFYEKCSYLRAGPIRVLDDLSHSLEFAYAKPLAGIAVRALDAAAAVSAIPGLAAVLVDCVGAGAAAGFRAPLAPAAAAAHCKRLASAAARGEGALVAGWCDGTLAGAAALAFDTPETHRHRGEIRTLLVAPAARHRGLGRLLLREAEAAARAAGRSLLSAAAPEADRLLRREGWTELGTLPDHARGADGTPQAAVWYWKRV